MNNLYKTVIAGLVMAFFFNSCGKEEEKAPETKVVRPVKMMTITTGGERLKRSFPGTVRASQRVDLSFQVSGPLTELQVEEGQEVKKGDLLARIDPRDFEVKLRNAKAKLATSRATLKAMKQARPEDIKRLEAKVSKAEAALKLAKSDYDRVMRIKKQDAGAVSQGMVDKALEKRDRAEAEVRDAKQELRIGKLGARPEDIQAKEAEIRSLKANVDAAKDQLGYTYLRAPFSGTIAKRYVDNFQKVQAKEPILSLQDISQIEILVDVPEDIMAGAKKTRAADTVVEFAAAPGKRFKVKLKEYSTEADPKTQTYRVVLTLPAPENINIFPGMTATVSGARSQKGSSRIVIPAIAVVADHDGVSNVWIIDKETMTSKKRKVRTGNLTGKDSIEILDGLNSGEMIAIAGVSRLREGMEVRPLTK